MEGNRDDDKERSSVDEESEGVSVKEALNWLTTIIGVILGAASGIATIITSNQSFSRHQDTETQLSALGAKVDAREEADKDTRVEVQRQLDELGKRISNINNQKNINTAAIATLSEEIKSGRETETEGARSENDRQEKEIQTLRSVIDSIQSRLDPEPGGQAANIREIRAEIAGLQQRANDAYDRASEVQRQLDLLERKAGDGSPSIVPRH
jgi:chromosome segregation ATPase